MFSSRNLLVGLVAASVSFGMSNDWMAIAQSSGFEEIINKYGGIKKGRTTSLTFSNNFNPKLHNALRREFRDMINSNWVSEKSYSYLEIDVNNDGKKDAFVQINNSTGAGSGGNHAWLFQATDNGYEVVHTFMHQIYIVVLPTQTNGWQDIMIVPGKIGMRQYGSSYYQCSYTPIKKWSGRGQNGGESPDNYRNCQNVRQNSTISGVVFSTSNFRNIYPKFDLTRESAIMRKY